MSQSEHDDLNGELTERGVGEREQISKHILKKKKSEMEAFFQGYRSFNKSENKKKSKRSNPSDSSNIMFDMLVNELEQSLTTTQKNDLAKKWRNKTMPPVILVAESEQLEDIQKYLCSRNLARVKVEEAKQIVDLRKTEVFGSDYGMTMNSTDTGSCMESISIMDIPDIIENNINFESFIEITESWSSDPSKDQSRYSSRSTFPNHVALETDEENEQLPIISEPTLNGNGEFENERTINDADSSCSVHSLYKKLSESIRIQNDVEKELGEIKRKNGFQMYSDVINYNGVDEEPITFSLALQATKHERVLESLKKDNLLNLDKRNHINMSMFSFLLINDFDTLYTFLKYTEKTVLLQEVKRVCSSDIYFQKAFLQLKKERKKNSQYSKIDYVEKLCFN